jgi:hypothetical protein
MSTLSEHTGNGNPTATSLQREDTKEQIDGVLQHFDVLPSRFDRSGDCVLRKRCAIWWRISAFLSPMAMPIHPISAFLSTIAMRS